MNPAHGTHRIHVIPMSDADLDELFAEVDAISSDEEEEVLSSAVAPQPVCDAVCLASSWHAGVFILRQPRTRAVLLSASRTPSPHILPA